MPTSTPVPIPPTPTVITGAKFGGVLRLVTREDVDHLDVQQELSPALSTWGPGIAYSRLLRFKSGPDLDLPSLEIECELCRRWWMEDDRTFVFELRDDVRWQNIAPVQGRFLEPGDVVFSYDRQRQASWPNASLLQNIETVEARGRDSIAIGLRVPDADFLLALADGHSKIVAREAVELNGDLREGPTVGTGPWVFDPGKTPGSHIFDANPDYFEEGLPLVEKLQVHIIEDAMTRISGFRVGLIDVIDMEPAEWEEHRDRSPDAPVLMAKEPGAGLAVRLNTTVWPFDDVRIRKAVFQAMDPWTAVEEVWLGAAYVGLGAPVVQPGWLLSEEELRPHFGRPDLARNRLGEAGFDLPVPVSITVGNFGAAYLEHGERIVREMEAVGFAPTLEVVNRRIFGDRIWMAGEYQMLIGPVPPVTTPNGYLLSFLHSEGGLNAFGYRSEELDRLIEAQATEYDLAERETLVQEIQRVVLEQAYLFMPAGRVSIWTWAARVQNLHPNFAGFEYGHWARVWLDDAGR